MLKKKMLLIFLLINTAIAFASEIVQITLEDLYEKSELIVMGEVINIKKDKNNDYVTIRIDVILKGECSSQTVEFMITSRGGLKDFDPELEIGQNGVFFLKNNGEKGFAKAYWGSMAIFEKNSFCRPVTVPQADK